VKSELEIELGWMDVVHAYMYRLAKMYVTN